MAIALGQVSLCPWRSSLADLLRFDQRIMAFCSQAQQKYNLLTKYQHSLSNTLSPSKYLELYTIKWLLHEWSFWLEYQRLSLSQSRPASVFLLCLWVDSKASSLDVEFYVYDTWLYHWAISRGSFLSKHSPGLQVHTYLEGVWDPSLSTQRPA